MITLTDGFLKMMNFNNVFRWHWPFLFLVLLTFRAAAADTLLILGDSLSAIYPKLAKEFDIPLLPFFMEEVYLKPQWMQDDGIHPNRDAQPFIADWMAQHLTPFLS